MPRFLVERDYEMVSEEAILEGVARGRSAMREHFPDLDWEHTHVCHTPGGEIKAFCVYSAPSAERLAEHTASMGGHTAHRIHEILGV
jgi:hypothetical protein